jgi:hypothetical protein
MGNLMDCESLICSLEPQSGLRGKKKVIGEPWFPGLTLKMVLN